MKATIVIPNYNGMKYLPECLRALQEQEYPAHILVVDNGSLDESVVWIKENYPSVELLCLNENTGFCGAVNEGIAHSSTPYVILLNNDTSVKPGFTKALVEAIEASENIFSVSAKMLDMKNEALVDSAGDLYCALGWAFARGKGKPAERYHKKTKIFSSCGGAAIYRKSILDEIGYFDRQHFAYLEDVDIGWRARIHGYVNLYEPKAEVLHAGSGASGSKYNTFKTNFSSTNSVYIIGKNMPLLQLLLNLPLLCLGFFIKALFFAKKKMGISYINGCVRGFKKCFSAEGRENKVPFQWKHLGNYCRLQIELWWNIFRRFSN